MPPFIQPQCLQDITLCHVTHLIHDACAQFKVTTSYNTWSEKNANFIIQFRNYLIEHLGHSMDEVYAAALVMINRTNIRAERFFLDIMIHQETRYLKKLPVGLDSMFLTRQLIKMENIITLNISGVNCTDGIMEIIGNTCRHLEQFRFRSTSDFCMHTEKEMRLTNIGFLHFIKCEKIRLINDSKQFYGYSVGLIKTLIRTLKQLEYVNFPDMARAVFEGMDNVVSKIKIISERNVQTRYIETMARVCPLLERIEFFRSGGGDYSKNDTLTKLSETSLVLTHIKLTNFPFDSKFRSLLKVKGKHLTELSINFSKTNELDEIGLKLIGETCPYLTSLYIGRNGMPTILDIYRGYRTEVNNLPMFQHLESLTITGPLDFNQGFVQICLSHANRIKEVFLFISNSNADGRGMGSIFTEVMNFNKMSELKRLTIFVNDALISKETISMIVESCVCLTECTFMGILDRDGTDYLVDLSERAKMENWDLDICWDSF